MNSLAEVFCLLVGLFAIYWFGCKPISHAYCRAIDHTLAHWDTTSPRLRSVMVYLATHRIGRVILYLPFPRLRLQVWAYRHLMTEGMRQRREFRSIFFVSPFRRIQAQSVVEDVLTFRALEIKIWHDARNELLNGELADKMLEVHLKVAEYYFARALRSAMRYNYQVTPDWRAYADRYHASRAAAA